MDGGDVARPVREREARWRRCNRLHPQGHGGRRRTALIGGETAERRPELAERILRDAAVFDRVTPTMTIAREEIFGPVLALIEAEDMEEAIELANDTEYGLSASHLYAGSSAAC